MGLYIWQSPFELINEIDKIKMAVRSNQYKMIVRIGSVDKCLDTSLFFFPDETLDQRLSYVLITLSEN